MKPKKWSLITAALMSVLLLLISPMAVFAEDDVPDAQASTENSLQEALAIVAPRIARVGQKISMTVFLRADQTTFAGAGIWLLSREAAETLQREIAALQEANTLSADNDFAAMFDIHGEMIGRSGNEGKLYYSFEESGNYVLAAFRQGYFPGFSRIGVGMLPDALGVTAPRRAAVNEDVTISVYKRGTAEPVADASVWSLNREQAEILQQEVAALREEISLSVDTDYENMVSVHGELLGHTDVDGELTISFDSAAAYPLVAVKRGYLPGHTSIVVGAIPLAIWAPWRADIGEDVAMTVFQRNTEQPVADAAIWVLTREKAEAARRELAAIRGEEVLNTDSDYESVISAHGELLGYTDEDGEFTHAFENTGMHLMVAVKDGYIPGFTPIVIRGMDSGEIPLETAS